ncbi:hypothetical protein ACCO45_013709 [Purpureocillium lilacinum]|uniref:Uncharacterized protein n=1 Tax=Purpureocillium lilacinum TaxID=33203 RepID=A0ACC4D827_PURLI
MAVRGRMRPSDPPCKWPKQGAASGPSPRTGWTMSCSQGEGPGPAQRQQAVPQTHGLMCCCRRDPRSSMPLKKQQASFDDAELWPSHVPVDGLLCQPFKGCSVWHAFAAGQNAVVQLPVQGHEIHCGQQRRRKMAMGYAVLADEDVFVEDGEAGMDDSKVKVDEGAAEGMHSCLDGVQVGYALSLRSDCLVCTNNENGLVIETASELRRGRRSSG